MSKHKFNRNFAVVIGINDYKNGIRELETAVPDAYKLAQIVQEQYQALKQQYQAQNKYEVQLILNKRATLNQLNQLISDFKKGQIPFDNEKVTVTEDDRVLFYFAGHGIALEALENQEGPVGYLIPQDATLEDSSTYLPMQELHDALNALPCRHMLAILDCCFAGAFRWASLKREIVPKVTVYKERYDRFISDRAWQVITSASDDQKALDSLGLRGKVIDGNEVHSPFAKALFDALRGGADEGADLNKDGIITATELYSYLRDKVETLTEHHYKRQTPGLCPLKKHDKGEFIFLLPYFDRDKLEDAPPLNLENNPYRGLQSYDEKDSHLFFGRENLIEKLCKKALDNKQALTLVLGASGTGKSSLMKAGLLPRLRDSQEHQFNILDPMRPGESPLEALAQVCLPTVTTMTAAELAEDEQALANIIERWSKNYPNTKLLLPVDQFEELITLCKSDQEREQFQKLIKNALAKYPDKIHVVITLRLDFEAQFQTSVLKDFWNDDTRFVVPPMTQDEFREAIEKPASEKVVYFDPPSLVDELINEVVQMPGALPLLSFTLSELYLKYLGDRTRNNRALTKKDYEELGRVVGSITKRANDEYDKLVAEDPAYKDTVRRVMLRMVTFEGGELARRRVPLSELVYADAVENERVKLALERFDRARLIVGGQETGEPYVEPAHDFLIRSWDKLQEWQQKEQEHLPLQRRLTPAAIEWKSKQEARFLWNADPYLDVLKQVLTSEKDNWFNQVEAEFVKRSIQRRERNRRIRGGLIATAFSIVSGFAFIQWKQNQEAQSINFAASSKTRLASQQQLDALVEVIKSGKTLRKVIGADAETTYNVVAALLQTVYSVKERNRWQGYQEFNFSADGNTLIFRKAVDGQIKFKYWNLEGKEISRPPGDNSFRFPLCRSDDPDPWDEKRYSLDGKTRIEGDYWDALITVSRLLYEQDKGQWQKLWTVQAHRGQNDGYIYCVRFSSDGRMFVSGSVDKTIKLWSVEGKPIKRFQAHNSKVNSVRFNPDGKTLASAGEEKTIRIWNLEGKELKTFHGDSEGVLSISFSPDGKTLASANDIDTRTITLWSLEGKEPKTLDGGNGANDISFSPDGKMLASANNDRSIKFWSPDGHSTRPSIPAHENLVNSVSFSPDSKMLVSSGKDGKTILWNLNKSDSSRGRQIGPLRGGSGVSQRVRFSPDGKMLAVDNDTDDRIRLLSIIDGRELRSFEGNTVSFSPDGKMLAFGSKEGNIKLWTIDGEELATIRGHNSAVSSLSFSPNGKRLASSSDDGTIVLWNLDFDELLAQACDWARGYLATLDEKDSDRKLCDDIPPITPSPQTTIANSSAPSIVQPSVQNAPSPAPSSNNRQDTPSSSALANAPARPQNVPSPTPPSNNGQNSYEQALSDRKQASKLNSVDVYINQGLTYHRQGKYKQAISNYSQVIALNPNSDKAYSNRAAAYNEQKDYQKAIADSSKAISLNPTYANAYINRGLAYYYQGNSQQAIADYTKAIELAPSNANAYNIRALAYTRLGNQQAAQADKQKAAALSRQQPQ